MVKAGIIDPTKVVRVALQDAGSVAGLLITTEAMVADRPEPKGAAGMPAGGGMGWHGLLTSLVPALLWKGHRLSLKTGEAIGPAHFLVRSLTSDDFQIELKIENSLALSASNESLSKCSLPHNSTPSINSPKVIPALGDDASPIDAYHQAWEDHRARRCRGQRQPRARPTPKRLATEKAMRRSLP